MNKPVEVPGLRRNRQTIYIGPILRAVLDRLKEATLSVVVNSMIERYTAIIGRVKPLPLMDFHAELYCNVLREMRGEDAGAIVTSAQIAAFPAYVSDWLARHPEFPPEPGKTALTILTQCTYVDLVALVDRMERHA